jgi:hypothetical protein
MKMNSLISHIKSTAKRLINIVDQAEENYLNLKRNPLKYSSY